MISGFLNWRGLLQPIRFKCCRSDARTAPQHQSLEQTPMHAASPTDKTDYSAAARTIHLDATWPGRAFVVSAARGLACCSGSQLAGGARCAPSVEAGCCFALALASSASASAALAPLSAALPPPTARPRSRPSCCAFREVPLTILGVRPDPPRGVCEREHEGCPVPRGKSQQCIRQCPGA